MAANSPPVQTVADPDVLVRTSVQLWPHQVDEADRRAVREGLKRADIIRRALDIGLGFRHADGSPRTEAVTP